MKLPTAGRIEQIVSEDNTTGFCLACGEEQDGVEPDAHEYVCESCGEAKVYGAEECLLMGFYLEGEGSEEE